MSGAYSDDDDEMMFGNVNFDAVEAAKPVAPTKKRTLEDAQATSRAHGEHHTAVTSLPVVSQLSEFGGAPITQPSESKKAKTEKRVQEAPPKHDLRVEQKQDSKGKPKAKPKRLGLLFESSSMRQKMSQSNLPTRGGKPTVVPVKCKGKGAITFRKQKVDAGTEASLPLPNEDEVVVQVSRDSLFASDKTFLDLERLVDALAKSHPEHEHPTLVQAASIPPIMKGRDILLRGQTGTGKTLSYVLPIFDKLASIEPRLQRSQGTFAIVISPTRELAVQIVEEFRKIALKHGHWVVSGFLIGGEKKKSEKARLRKGLPILVATPGRLLDHLQTTQAFFFRNLKYLVFDEADRLLDLGFEHDIRNIVDELKKRKRTDIIPQTMLVSATLWDGVKELAALTLHNPVFVNVNTVSDQPDSDKVYTGEYDSHQQFETPSSLKQHYVIVPCKTRLAALAAFLRWQLSKNTKVMVFFSSCDSVDFFYTLFCNVRLILENDTDTSVFGDHATIHKLHGKMSQLDRLTNFDKFRASQCGVLLCTDAAARGLDVPNVSFIVQFDPPPEPKEYIHRVGRTARIGQQGNALLFLMPAESEYVSLMANHGVEMAQISLERLIGTLELVAFSLTDGVSSVEKMMQLVFERFVMREREVKEQATRAFVSFVRAYATHARGTKHIFHPKSLHLGHVSKSFALRDAPTQLLGNFRKKFSHNNYMTEAQAERKEARRATDDRTKRTKQAQALFMSEFSSGI